MEENNTKIEVDYSGIDAIIEEIIAKASTYMVNVSKDLIRNTIIRAYDFTKEAHHGQFRKS